MSKKKVIMYIPLVTVMCLAICSIPAMAGDMKPYKGHFEQTEVTLYPCLGSASRRPRLS